MTLRLTCLALGLGLLAAGPALADGYGRGGYKDGRGVAVPVPVPAPVPDYGARWYMRADLSLGFMSADPSESGIIYGENLYPPADLTGGPLDVSTFSGSNSETTFSFGGGFGYYWSPYFRTDLTLEGRVQQDLKIRGTYSYTQDTGGTDQVDGVTRDNTQVNSGLILFNAYFDLTRGSAFTPYVGGGVGVSVNQLRRNFSNEEYICAPGAPGDCFDPANLARDEAESGTKYTASLAAAAMAGFTYALSPVTMLDISYRYLYIGSSDISLRVGDAATRSTLSTGDIHEHQLRAGLRWNIQ